MTKRATNRRPRRSAGFQTCCVADFQIGATRQVVRSAGLETRDTADSEVCATGVAQVSKPAVSPISKSAGREMTNGPRVWKPAIQQTWKSALRRSAIGVAPLPVLRVPTQSSSHWVVSDVAGNSGFFVLTPNPVVVGLRLPESLFTHSQDLLGATRSKLLPRFQDITQQVIRHRPDDGVNMVGHHNPLVKQIPAFVKVPQRIGNQISDVRSAQMTGACATVKIAFNPALKVASNFFFRVIDGFASLCKVVQSSQSLRFFPPKLQQRFLWQRIGQAKRDKVRGAFALHMWKVAPCVNACAKCIWRFALHATGSKLVTRSLQTWIRFFRFVGLHSARIASRIPSVEHRANDIAQVSKPAVSPISKSAGRPNIPSALSRRASGGFGNPRYSRLGSLRYALCIFASPRLCCELKEFSL